MASGGSSFIQVFFICFFGQPLFAPDGDRNHATHLPVLSRPFPSIPVHPTLKLPDGNQGPGWFSGSPGNPSRVGAGTGLLVATGEILVSPRLPSSRSPPPFLPKRVWPSLRELFLKPSLDRAHLVGFGSLYNRCRDHWSFRHPDHACHDALAALASRSMTAPSCPRTEAAHAGRVVRNPGPPRRGTTATPYARPNPHRHRVASPPKGRRNECGR